MSLRAHRRNVGGAWTAGLGVLGLLITVGIIMYMVSIWADSVSSSTGGRGPGPLLDRVREQTDAFSQRNKNLVPQPEPNAATATTAPAPADNPQPAPKRSGAPEAGTPIGPISPVTPVAPMTNDQPGVNTKNLKTPAKQLDDAMKKRNEELEKALKGE